MRKRKDTVRNICLAFVLFFSCFCLSACGEKSYFQTKSDGFLEEDDGHGGAQDGGERSPEEDDADGKSSPKDKAAGGSTGDGTDCYVDVCGAVTCPGVYLLRSGSRVFEAIQMAGGLKADADTRNLNQAAVITDGQKLYIHTVGEIPAELPGQTGTESISDGKVNINTASREELMTLPGIGEAKADAMIAYRQEKGLFSSVEEIKNISGIKEGVYSKIADSIKVN